MADLRELPAAIPHCEGIECYGMENPNLASAEMHPCPFHSDVQNDDSDHCRCCENCTGACAMEV
jgi:hypothetical protein